MTDNDRMRRSISAIVDEIVMGHQALQIPINESELCEAYGLLVRIEKTMLHMGQGVLD